MMTSEHNLNYGCMKQVILVTLEILNKMTKH